MKKIINYCESLSDKLYDFIKFNCTENLNNFTWNLIFYDLYQNHFNNIDRELRK
jgi:hypothetical protein